MKTNPMRVPLLQAAVVLLFFVLLAYLTSATSNGGLFSSIGLIIIGFFRFIQWSIAMVIGMSVAIAVLIGFFLLAVAMMNKESAVTMYHATKASVIKLVKETISTLKCPKCKEATCCTAAPAGTATPVAQVAAEPVPAEPTPETVDPDALKDEMQSVLDTAMSKVAETQQSLDEHLTELGGKLEALEEKISAFASTEQVQSIAGEISGLGDSLKNIKTKMGEVEGKLGDATGKLAGLAPDKILGDLPNRLQQMEQQLKQEETTFDPKPLTDAIEALKAEIESVKKKPAAKPKAAPSKSRKK